MDLISAIDKCYKCFTRPLLRSHTCISKLSLCLTCIPFIIHIRAVFDCLFCYDLAGNTVYLNQGAHGLDIWSDNDYTTSHQIIYKNQFYSNYPGDKFKVSILEIVTPGLYRLGVSL